MSVPSMKVYLARHYGMCFGVRDALQRAQEVREPHRVTVYGELVHNPKVNQKLAQRGFVVQSEVGRDATIPETPQVMITAHGVSHRDRDALHAMGKELIDTTCPLVFRVHAAAQQLEGEGRHVIVAGRHGHVEVIGITRDLTDFTVISSPDEVPQFSEKARLGVIAQSTTPPALFEVICEEIRWRNPQADLRVVETICRPTRDRQQAAQELVQSGKIEALVVVGGANSNNTLQLGRLAEQAALPWCRVGGAEELDEEWLAQFRTVGLTAGTSTPEEVVQAVKTHLEQIPARVRDERLLRSH